MSFRDRHSSVWRAGDVRHTIDPGFVHFRKIETFLGVEGMEIIDEQIGQIPPLSDWQRQLRIEHVYTRTMLRWCQVNSVPPLREILAKQRGRIFCSTEVLGPCPDLYERERAISPVALDGQYPWRVELHYSTRHIYGTTPKERLRGGFTFSVIAELHRFDNNVAVFEPIVMGAPWLESDQNEYQAIEWYSTEFYEDFIEDFDEFQKVKAIPSPPDSERMRHVSEAAFKSCLVEVLGGFPPKDWGGESSDFYTTHLHLAGKRVTGAFLLKGPARFEPMGLNHLGKNNDQIVRLADEPADVLFVQHCHDILPAVRKTLRAFAVQPSRPRRYCLVDGRDSLRLLDAYELYDRAVASN